MPSSSSSYQYSPGRWVRFLMWLAVKTRSTDTLVFAFMFAAMEEKGQRLDHRIWGPRG